MATRGDKLKSSLQQVPGKASQSPTGFRWDNGKENSRPDNDVLQDGAAYKNTCCKGVPFDPSKRCQFDERVASDGRWDWLYEGEDSVYLSL